MLTTVPSPQELYDETAQRWVRKQPITLSDFTGRIPLLAMAEPVAGKSVLDLGCGEGYFARHLRARGASLVIGMDQSAGMIELAQKQEAADPLGIDYRQGCATDLSTFAEGSFDMTIAVFLFNYLTVEQTRKCMAEVARVVKPGGRFLFAVPHPAFPFMRRPEPPVLLQRGRCRLLQRPRPSLRGKDLEARRHVPRGPAPPQDARGLLRRSGQGRLPHHAAGARAARDPGARGARPGLLRAGGRYPTSHGDRGDAMTGKVIDMPAPTAVTTASTPASSAKAIRRLRQLGKAHALWTHPFLARCMEGQIGLHDVRALANQMYRFTREFSPLLARILAACPDEDVRVVIGENLFEELGEGDPQKTHVELFRHFTRALGLDDATLEAIPAEPETAGWSTCTSR
jgi:SAM-dependent methyltransferase